MGTRFGYVLDNQGGWFMLSKSNQGGFTMIELIIGLVIVSILIALAAPSYRGWIQNQQIRTAAESLLNGVQLARVEAIKNNGRARFSLCGFPNSSWEVLALPVIVPAAAPANSLVCGAASNALASEVRVQERSAQEGSILATVVVTPAGASEVTFNGFGRVVANANNSATLTKFDITTPTGDRPLTVTVGAGGTTRMCDPSPLLPANDPRRC